MSQRHRPKHYRNYLQPGVQKVRVPRSTFYRKRREETGLGLALQQCLLSAEQQNDRPDLSHSDEDGVLVLGEYIPTNFPTDGQRLCGARSSSEENLSDLSHTTMQLVAPMDSDSDTESLPRPDKHNNISVGADLGASDVDDTGIQEQDNSQTHYSDLSTDGSAMESNGEDIDGSADDIGNITGPTGNEDAEDRIPRFKKSEYLDAPLRPGSNITKFGTLMMILHFSMRYSLTGVALEGLLKLINAIFEEDVIPGSSYRINKIFRHVDSPNNFHFYCRYCSNYIGNRELIERSNITSCLVCQGNFNLNTSMNKGLFFITISVEDQMRILLEDPNFSSQLSYRFERVSEEGVIADIYDGLNYKALSQAGNILSDPNNYSFTFNTDGAPVFKSCKNSIWPIQLIVNELPPSERFQPHNVLITGLWFGNKEPKMSVFLKPFVEEFIKLGTEGMVWQGTDGQPVNSKLVALCCSVDSVAKPTIQKLTQFNGYSACGYCKHPGEKIERNQIRYTFSENLDRTAKGMRKDMKVAHRTKTIVNGVKGVSALIALPYFDIVFGFVIDYMHAVLLGVVRQMANIWFSTSNHNEPYYVGLEIAQVDERIANITPPKSISRSPRPISDRVHWKANEWRSWLLFYSLPCLKDILGREYYEHFTILVSAIFILLQEKISYDEIDNANILLVEFVSRYQQLYGKLSMTYNVHLLTHLAKIVSLWGPLWSHSCFVFESGNGYILQLIKGKTDVVTQVANKYNLRRSIHQLLQMYTVDQSVIAYCETLMEYKMCKNVVKCNESGIMLLGYSHVIELEFEEQNAFRNAGLDVPEKVEMFNKLIFKSSVYYSKSYKKPTKTNDCVISLNNGNRGLILKIIKDNNIEYIIFKSIDILDNNIILPDQRSGAKAAHIMVCHITDTLMVVPAKDILCKCILIDCGGHQFITDFPNRFEKD